MTPRPKFNTKKTRHPHMSTQRHDTVLPCHDTGLPHDVMLLFLGSRHYSTLCHDPVVGRHRLDRAQGQRDLVSSVWGLVLTANLPQGSVMWERASGVIWTSEISGLCTLVGCLLVTGTDVGGTILGLWAPGCVRTEEAGEGAEGRQAPVVRGRQPELWARQHHCSSGAPPAPLEHLRSA